MKKISEFLSENVHVLMVKFLIYLNRRVFVMMRRNWCTWYIGFKDIERECVPLRTTSTQVFVTFNTLWANLADDKLTIVFY